MGDFSDFQRGQIVDAHLAGTSVTKTTTRAAVARVMTTYTNHGRTSTKGNSGQKPKLSERDHCTMKGFVSINHKRTTAKVAAELHIHLEDRFHKNSLMRASQIHQHSW